MANSCRPAAENRFSRSRSRVTGSAAPASRGLVPPPRAAPPRIPRRLDLRVRGQGLLRGLLLAQLFKFARQVRAPAGPFAHHLKRQPVVDQRVLQRDEGVSQQCSGHGGLLIGHLDRRLKTPQPEVGVHRLFQHRIEQPPRPGSSRFLRGRRLSRIRNTVRCARGWAASQARIWRIGSLSLFERHS